MRRSPMGLRLVQEPRAVYDPHAKPTVRRSRLPGVVEVIGQGITIDPEAALDPFNDPSFCPGEPGDLSRLTVSDVRRLSMGMHLVYRYLDTWLIHGVTPERMIEVPLCKRRTLRMTAETLRTTLSNLLYDLQVSAARGQDA
jgi:hypothetical protein